MVPAVFWGLLGYTVSGSSRSKYGDLDWVTFNNRRLRNFAVRTFTALPLSVYTAILPPKIISDSTTKDKFYTAILQ